MIDRDHLLEVVSEILPQVTEIRRAIHRRPELAYEEFATTELLAETVRGAGFIPRTRTPRTGLSVDIGSNGPTVAFRADIDALPIQEPARLSFASEVPGVMHGCGHDAHAAVAAGVVMGLSKLGVLPGRARVIFQPAEETFPGGAHDLIRDGLLEGVGAIYAFHVDPTVDAGHIGVRTGPITASADRLFVTLEGPGGHTARPYRSVDLVFAAGKVAAELPALLDRMTDARIPISLVFGQINGGTAVNVIPTTVEMAGTCRTLDRAMWDEIPSLVERLIQDIVAPLGAKVTIHYQRGIPPVVNEAVAMAIAERAMNTVLGPGVLVPAPASLGAEDFARYLHVVPGGLLRLGAKPPGPDVDLHSAAFSIDEAALETGVTAALAILFGWWQENGAV